MMRTLASRAVSINELAKEFSVTRRQIYRDLQEIECQGHPLVQHNDATEKTWQLPLAYRGMPAITLSPYELMSLHLARAYLTFMKGTPFLEDLEGVIQKLQAGLPRKVINHLDRILQVFAPIQRPIRSYTAQTQVFQNVRKGLLLQRKLILCHRKPGYPATVRHTVDPYALLLYQGGIYLAGYSHRSLAIRLFAMERVKSASITERMFEIPEEFRSEKLLSNSFGLIEEPPKTIRIRFSSNVAYLIRERQWHPTQKVKRLENGDVLLTMRLGGQDEIMSWVLSWGPSAKVLSPPTLVEAVTKQLAAAQAQYSR